MNGVIVPTELELIEEIGESILGERVQSLLKEEEEREKIVEDKILQDIAEEMKERNIDMKKKRKREPNKIHIQQQRKKCRYNENENPDYKKNIICLKDVVPKINEDFFEHFKKINKERRLKVSDKE
jgi:hypothetical protein